MRVPQVSERIKEAPAQALRGVFAGIGQLLLITDKLRHKTPADQDVPRARMPETAETVTDTPVTSPASSPDPSADPSPTSQLDILLTKIPAAVRNQNNGNSCQNAGTGFGATAVSQCQQLRGLAANLIIYYLYPSRTALASGFSAFLKKQKFTKAKECTTNGSFSDFIVECQSDFTIKTPGATGSIAEYTSTTQNPIIVSTEPPCCTRETRSPRCTRASTTVTSGKSELSTAVIASSCSVVDTP